MVGGGGGKSGRGSKPEKMVGVIPKGWGGKNIWKMVEGRQQ